MKLEKVDVFIIGMPKNLFWERIYRLSFPLDLWKVFKWLPKLKEFDEIIVHLYPLTWLAYLAKRRYKVKYTFWYHGIMSPKFLPRLYERIYMRLQIFLTRLTVGNADRAVAVSKFGQAELKKYTGLNSEVSYVQINPNRFHPKVNGAKIREKLNLGNAPIILSVGAVRPVKGVHQLVQAFNLVKRELTDVKLVIIGKHDYKYYSDQLREVSDDSVIFIDFVLNKELPQYYAVCDIYATCSFWESCNQPALEAQACGKPVIAWHESFRETLDENGVLVESGNIEKFARACIEKLKQVRGIRF